MPVVIALVIDPLIAAQSQYVHLHMQHLSSSIVLCLKTTGIRNACTLLSAHPNHAQRFTHRWTPASIGGRVGLKRHEDRRWEQWEDYVQRGQQEAAFHVIHSSAKAMRVWHTRAFSCRSCPKSYWAWQWAQCPLHFALLAPQRGGPRWVPDALRRGALRAQRFGELEELAGRSALAVHWIGRSRPRANQIGTGSPSRRLAARPAARSARHRSQGRGRAGHPGRVGRCAAGSRPRGSVAAYSHQSKTCGSAAQSCHTCANPHGRVSPTPDPMKDRSAYDSQLWTDALTRAAQEAAARNQGIGKGKLLMCHEADVVFAGSARKPRVLLCCGQPERAAEIGLAGDRTWKGKLVSHSPTCTARRKLYEREVRQQIKQSLQDVTRRKKDFGRICAPTRLSARHSATIHTLRALWLGRHGWS